LEQYLVQATQELDIVAMQLDHVTHSADFYHRRVQQAYCEVRHLIEQAQAVTECLSWINLVEHSFRDSRDESCHQMDISGLHVIAEYQTARLAVENQQRRRESHEKELETLRAQVQQRREALQRLETSHEGLQKSLDSTFISALPVLEPLIHAVHAHVPLALVALHTENQHVLWENLRLVHILAKSMRLKDKDIGCVGSDFNKTFDSFIDTSTELHQWLETVETGLKSFLNVEIGSTDQEDPTTNKTKKGESGFSWGAKKSMALVVRGDLTRDNNNDSDTDAAVKAHDEERMMLHIRQSLLLRNLQTLLRDDLAWNSPEENALMKIESKAVAVVDMFFRIAEQAWAVLSKEHDDQASQESYQSHSSLSDDDVRCDAEKDEHLSELMRHVKVVQERNRYGLHVMKRVKEKLDGHIDQAEPSSVPNQVQWLIEQATSVDNLSVMYEGWTPWI
jgi:phosphatidylinositol kinase/protein kinase (PI-3  family)